VVPLRAEKLMLIFHMAVLVTCKKNIEDEKPERSSSPEVPGLFLGSLGFCGDASEALGA
jgi:hypothetical protein